ncbi:LacI family DNA-binding transcriptional regulator [Cryptosporangium minutisporangium]|uniref:LacI family DNA-binding transcriptional regulator n=1 Tax=Cryptosporangium minutisporangium TaxID=113569 RepID=A0ABP6SYE1_9ACTN
MAAHAGVSAGTVSNVLNRPEAVAPATLKRVRAAIAELGFVPHEAARALSAGRSRTVGLVVPDVTNPFFADVARGAEAVADRHDVVVILYNTGASPERELRYFGQLEERRVQGVLVTPVDQQSRHLDELLRRGTPVVLVDRHSARRDVCSVAVDDVWGGRLAAEHLVEQGHRRLAFVGGPLVVPQVTDRLAGAREVADETGTAVEVIETPGLTVAAGRAAGAAIARRASRTRPTAAFCANDLLALGLLQAVTREGLRVPQDVAIVGYDDIDYAAGAAVPLTTVQQPREELGQVAADLLFDSIDFAERHRHRQVVFQPELVVRESSTHARRGSRTARRADPPTT